LEVPDVARALLCGNLAEVPCGELVVVDDVKALAAVRACEHRRVERPVALAAVADELARARARPLPGPLRGGCGLGAHAGTLNDARGQGVCVNTSSPPSASHSSSARWGVNGPSIWTRTASAAVRASRFGALSAGSRASTRFSKSLMRSNSRIRLRTALCISS